jgi:hypothetical protein
VYIILELKWNVGFAATPAAQFRACLVTESHPACRSRAKRRQISGLARFCRTIGDVRSKGDASWASEPFSFRSNSTSSCTRRCRPHCRALRPAAVPVRSPLVFLCDKANLIASNRTILRQSPSRCAEHAREFKNKPRRPERGNNAVGQGSRGVGSTPCRAKLGRRLVERRAVPRSSGWESPERSR